MYSRTDDVYKQANSIARYIQKNHEVMSLKQITEAEDFLSGLTADQSKDFELEHPVTGIHSGLIGLYIGRSDGAKIKKHLNAMEDAAILVGPGERQDEILQGFVPLKKGFDPQTPIRHGQLSGRKMSLACCSLNFSELLILIEAEASAAQSYNDFGGEVFTQLVGMNFLEVVRSGLLDVESSITSVKTILQPGIEKFPNSKCHIIFDVVCEMLRSADFLSSPLDRDVYSDRLAHRFGQEFHKLERVRVSQRSSAGIQPYVLPPQTSKALTRFNTLFGFNGIEWKGQRPTQGSTLAFCKVANKEMAQQMKEMLSRCTIQAEVSSDKKDEAKSKVFLKIENVPALEQEIVTKKQRAAPLLEAFNQLKDVARVKERIQLGNEFADLFPNVEQARLFNVVVVLLMVHTPLSIIHKLYGNVQEHQQHQEKINGLAPYADSDFNLRHFTTVVEWGEQACIDEQRNAASASVIASATGPGFSAGAVDAASASDAPGFKSN
jgi:hypothetical protein